MSRPRKYTPNTLKKAVNGYFDSISRLVPLTEKRNTGRKDSDGHVIYEEVPVLNRLGVQATVLEYLVPPTVGGLCEHLGIHRPGRTTATRSYIRSFPTRQRTRGGVCARGWRNSCSRARM